MSSEEDRPISGYGSRLERLVNPAIDRFRRVRGDANALDVEVRKFLHDGRKLGLAAEHILEQQRFVVSLAGYPEAEIADVLSRAGSLVAPGTYLLIVMWHNQKPSAKEIVTIRSLVQNLAEMPIPRCKKMLEEDPKFLLGTYRNLLEAEAAKERVDEVGLSTVVRKQNVTSDG